MINISKNAQKYFISLLSSEPEGTQIRIFVMNAGRFDAECGLAFCLESEIEESDIQFKYEKFCVYLNKDILVYLKNAEIDLITDKIGSQLTLKAPYAKHNLSEKKFTLKDKITHFLNTEINPQLSMHGGQVHLMQIDKESGTAIIKFSGGCNGCSMINLTLKDTVEKKILSSFPEIKQVSDQTEHLRGQHSFY